MAEPESPSSGQKPPASSAELRSAGKALREKIPRSLHARWAPPPDRPDPVDLMQHALRDAVPELVPIRFGRMAASPFAFFRGSAAIMGFDLSTSPVTGSRVQLCGDAHVSNFGVFATPERDQVFDVNDFDETIPGPWEWDLKRLAASLVLAGRENALTAAERKTAVCGAIRGYRDAMEGYARASFLDVWYSHLDRRTVRRQVRRLGRREIDRAVLKARARTGLSVFPKLVVHSRGRFRIRDDPPLLTHFDHGPRAADTRHFFDQYLRTLPEERRALFDRYHLVDTARKVVGVGSVGTVCAVMLLLGNDDRHDPLFLQLKQANASVLEPFAGASRFANHGERVVVGQRLIQEASDIFLGWSTLGSRDFYVRQLRDMKFSEEIASMRPRTLAGHGELCGSALARAHARTGHASLIRGYLGRSDAFDEALARFGERYADQVERDHAELLRAIRSGRVRAETHV